MRCLALLVLAGYLLGVAWLALRPLPVLWVSPPNTEPLATIRADLAQGPGRAVRTIGGGMLRLAPLGVLLPLLGRCLGGSRLVSLVRTVFAGAMVALALEMSQTLVPSRVADVDTVLLNTLGIAVAHLLCYGRLRAWAPRVAPDERPAPGARPAARDADTPRAATAPPRRAAARPAATEAGPRGAPAARPPAAPEPRPGVAECVPAPAVGSGCPLGLAPGIGPDNAPGAPGTTGRGPARHPLRTVRV